MVSSRRRARARDGAYTSDQAACTQAQISSGYVVRVVPPHNKYSEYAVPNHSFLDRRTQGVGRSHIALAAARSGSAAEPQPGAAQKGEPPIFLHASHAAVGRVGRSCCGSKERPPDALLGHHAPHISTY